jgi:hypothetical protein
MSGTVVFESGAFDNADRSSATTAMQSRRVRAALRGDHDRPGADYESILGDISGMPTTGLLTATQSQGQLAAAARLRQGDGISRDRGAGGAGGCRFRGWR